jgi:dihydropteroate synthase
VPLVELVGQPGEEGVDLVHPVAPKSDREPDRADGGAGEWGTSGHERIGPVVVHRLQPAAAADADDHRGAEDEYDEYAQQPHHGSDRATLGDVRDHQAGALRLGTRVFAPGETAVMAIVNRTPDSFFDAGATFGLREAMDRVDRAVEEGADIVDIGGVKAGYGDYVSVDEELRRTSSFVAQVRSRHPDVVLSVDTWRSEVARELCGQGADVVNDTWAGADPAVAEVAAEFGAGLVCSHTGGLGPRTDPHRVHYADVVADVVARTGALAARAVELGVRRDGVLVDPTHDFGKNTYHSLELTRRLDEVVAVGWPVLVAVSRKDFVGETLDRPAEDRLAGTLAVTAVSAWQGARVFRTHDVTATRDALRMVGAVRGTVAPAVPRRGLA